MREGGQGEGRASRGAGHTAAARDAAGNAEGARRAAKPGAEAGGGGGKSERKGGDAADAPPAPVSVRLVQGGRELRHAEGRAALWEEALEDPQGFAFELPDVAQAAGLRDVQAQVGAAPLKLQRLERGAGAGGKARVCTVPRGVLLREAAAGRGECAVQLRVRRAGREWSAWSEPLALAVRSAGGRGQSAAGKRSADTEEASKASTDSGGQGEGRGEAERGVGDEDEDEEEGGASDDEAQMALSLLRCQGAAGAKMMSKARPGKPAANGHGSAAQGHADGGGAASAARSSGAAAGASSQGGQNGRQQQQQQQQQRQQQQGAVRDVAASSPVGRVQRADLRVWIGGLPAGASWQDLKDHMKLAGNVTYTDVDSQGRATVEYASPEDAARAVRSLDGSALRLQGVRGPVRISVAPEAPARGARQGTPGGRMLFEAFGPGPRAQRLLAAIQAQGVDLDERVRPCPEGFLKTQRFAFCCTR
jgi:hypothetical protein